MAIEDADQPSAKAKGLEHGTATGGCDRHRGTAILIALLALPAVSAATDVVQVEDHGDGHYTLTTTLAETTDPAHGQLAIAPTAIELCGDQYPHYGRYRFEAKAPSRAAGTSAPTSLLYMHDIACRATPQDTVETASDPVPPAPSTPPADEDETRIRAGTLAYLRAKDAADAATAYAMLSKDMAGYATPEAWATAHKAFSAQAGPGAAPAIVRITWYDNPQGAPTHGRYAAADYRVDYPSDAFTCGYVVWLRQASGDYLIVREEEAQITPDVIADLSPEERQTMRAQVQCRD